jgi:hypothetical protein
LRSVSLSCPLSITSLRSFIETGTPWEMPIAAIEAPSLTMKFRRAAASSFWSEVAEITIHSTGVTSSMRSESAA